MRLLGPCFNPYDTNTVECSFDDKATPGIYVDQKALCVSPDMDTIGRVEVKVMVKSDGKTIFNHTAPFYSGKLAFTYLKRGYITSITPYIRVGFRKKVGLLNMTTHDTG